MAHRMARGMHPSETVESLPKCLDVGCREPLQDGPECRICMDRLSDMKGRKGDPRC
jgi:hypothetical protein